MQTNIKEFLAECGVEESFYPGKRLVRGCPISGDHKSHSVVFDWRHPEAIRVEVRAGITGRELSAKDLVLYPVSFQAPTFAEFRVAANGNLLGEGDREDEDEEGDRSSGKGGGGGKRPKLTDKEKMGVSLRSFGDVVKGQTPEAAELKRLVVMGMEIAKEAWGSVLSVMKEQVAKTNIKATDMLAKAGKFVTRYTPPAFLQAKGDETAVYQYNREKNEPMFGMNLT